MIYLPRPLPAVCMDGGQFTGVAVIALTNDEALTVSRGGDLYWASLATIQIVDEGIQLAAEAGKVTADQWATEAMPA